MSGAEQSSTSIDLASMDPPPYVGTVFIACAVALDSTVGRRLTRFILPRPPSSIIPRRLLRPRNLHPAEISEFLVLRRHRLWCAVVGAAHGALALALGRLATVLHVPGVALQALTVAALGAVATSLLMEIRLVEIGVAAVGMRRVPGIRGFIAVLRGAVHLAALVGFAAAVWVPDH